jgi:hypothetical protein
MTPIMAAMAEVVSAKFVGWEGISRKRLEYIPAK